MQTAREWLVPQGLAKPGRGKFSKAAHAALAEAIKAGTKFSDYPKNGTAPRPAKNSEGGNSSQNSAPAPVTPENSLYVCPSDFRFPEGEYIARGNDGRTYSLRECCNTCRVSLTNHACNHPTIHGNLPVTIVAKRGVA